MTLKINPNLKPAELKTGFTENNRLQISSFLEEKSAAELHKLLSTGNFYKFKYNEGDRENWIKVTELESMTGRRLRDLSNKFYNSAMEGNHQYSLFACPINAETFKSNPKMKAWQDIRKFVESKDFRGFLETLSGLKISRLTAEAQWHKPDSFETTGDGTRKGEDRLLGFSLEMSRDWNYDWGGVRFFRGEEGWIEDAYSPIFNSLTVFKVPMNQSRSVITAFSKGLSLTLSGWGIK